MAGCECGISRVTGCGEGRGGSGGLCENSALPIAANCAVRGESGRGGNAQRLFVNVS